MNKKSKKQGSIAFLLRFICFFNFFVLYLPRVYQKKVITMNAVSLNNLWTYLQGLSLSASNQRWLGERLIEASATQTATFSEEELKLKKLNALFGVWSDQEGEQIEAAIREAREAEYERELVSMDE